MASMYVSYTGQSLEQLAALIRQNVTAFDGVEYVNGQGILIKGADGKTYCRIADMNWTYFYQEGTDDPTSASPTLFANGYYGNGGWFGMTEYGIMGCDPSGNAKYILTRSYHGEYAFITQVNSSDQVQASSQTSLSWGSRQNDYYDLGNGSADLQTILNYFPLRTGTHPTDCTPSAYIALTYQSNSFMGLVSFDGKPYIQMKRWFLKGIST